MNDIALIVSDMGNGGTQRVFATMSNRWAECGRNVCLITQAAPNTDFHILHPGVERLVFGRIGNSNGFLHGLFSNISRIISLRRALRQGNAPVSLAALPPTAILSLIAGIGLPTKVVVAERNDPGRQSYGLIWDFLRRLFYPRAALVTANSKGALDSLGKFVAADRLAYLPNPLKFDQIAIDETARRPIILNVGRLHRQKGQDVLIKAFAIIAGEYPEWRLAIAGSGELGQSLRQLAQSQGVAERIDWLGQTVDIWAHYAEASIFAFPSRHEGMPNALLEAMSAGLPAIITQASPGPLEQIENGVNGIVVPVDDPPALADALRTLIDDAPLRARHGHAARERTRELSLDNVMAQWEKVLDLPPLSQPGR